MAPTSGFMRPPPQSRPLGGDQNKAELLKTVIWVLTSLSTVMVGLRLFTRLRLIRNPGRDDVAVFVATILNITGASLISKATTAGLGRHLYYLRPDQLSKAIKFVSFSQPFCVMSFSLSKVAVALLLIRVMPPTFKRGAWFLYGLTGIQLLFGVVAIIIQFTQCSPPRSLWDLSLPLKCWRFAILQDFLYTLGAYSVLCDVSLALFPIIIFWSLQLQLGTKIGICCVMGLGVFTAACTIIKTTKLSERMDLDFTWLQVDLLLWALIETNVTIICCCLPTLRPLIPYSMGKVSGGLARAARYKNDLHRIDADEIALHTNQSKGASRLDLHSEHSSYQSQLL